MNCKVKQGRRERRKEPKQVFGVDGDMIQIESDLHQDFRMVNLEEHLRGLYESERDRSYVYLARHATLDDIINTCGHEAIHYAIRHQLESVKDTDESWNMSIDEEHYAINYMGWAPEFLVYEDDEKFNETSREDLND